MELSRFIVSVTPSQTLAFNKRTIELLKAGEDVIKLTAGEPDFPTPEPIIKAAIKAMEDGKTKYTDSTGIIELREGIANKLRKDNSLNYSADEIVVTNGGKQAIYNVLKALLNIGDEVIIIAPAWVSYDAQIVMCGGKTVFVNSYPENKFVPRIDDIEKSLTSKTRAIIINSPNNPTGAIYPEEFLEDLALLAKKNDLIVISDEVYEKLSFDAKHKSIASLDGMKDNVVVINAFSKTYSMTGWRVGYLAAPKRLSKEIAKIQSHLCSNVNTIAQYAALKALEVDTDNMVDTFKERRVFVEKKLTENNLNYVHPMGAFYVFVDIRPYLGGKYKDSLSFALELLEKGKVGMVPGSAFSYEGFIRLSYSSSLSDLEKGLNRFIKFVKSI